MDVSTAPRWTVAARSRATPGAGDPGRALAAAVLLCGATSGALAWLVLGASPGAVAGRVVVASAAWSAAAVLLGALAAFGSPAHPVRAGAVGAAAAMVGTVAVAAAVPTVPWPALGLHPLPAGAALSVLAGALAVGLRPGPAPARSHPRCSRAARLVVLGLVLVGTGLTAALLAWTGDVVLVGRGPVVPGLPLGGVLPAAVLLGALAWRASGRHPLTTLTALTAHAMLLVVSATSPWSAATLLWAGVDGAAAGTALAAAVTSLVTTFLAADRRAASDALGSLD